MSLLIKEYYLNFLHFNNNIDSTIPQKVMEDQTIQCSPQELFLHTKKHPHSHSISSQAFSVANKDIVIYNISLKSDPQSNFDIANYRRGLTLLEEIIDYKEGPLRVARKGLRKFFDILPEYLSVKNSHITSSKFHIHRKDSIFGQISKFKADQYTIYSTEKANGENAQISWDQEGGFWVIGSKNKTLLLAEQKDMKYIQHKHEHIRTLAIAEMWFEILNKNPDQVKLIKEELSKYTLVGEHCDTIKSGHIIDYGKQKKLMFYALVEKQGKVNSCQSPRKLIEFLKEANLNEYSVKFQINNVKTYEALIEELRKQVYRINEAKMQDEGEGRVIYITAQKKGQGEQNDDQCLSVFKLKTLEYRIYRKLREKIRIYFEKIKKSYDKILHKYIQEVKELAKGFELPKPQEYYFDIGKKAFELCEDQGKAVSRFVHNKFVAFLKILQSGPISKQNFMAIVNDSGDTELLKFLNQQKTDPVQKVDEKIIKNQNNQEVSKGKKKLMIIIPLTIPSSGKSTLFKKIKQVAKNIKIQILSSDTVRFEVMAEKMKQKKSMSKKAAYEKSRKQANQRYYKYMGNIIKAIAKDTSENNQFLFFLDKNHPESALKPAVAEARAACELYSKDLQYKIVGLIPQCSQLLQNKPKFMYPFSSGYVLACAKRVLGRQQHQTLQGSQNQRVNICVGFANLFRNFSISQYHIHKYFDFAIKLKLTNQNTAASIQSMNKLNLKEQLLKIMLGSKPGSFDEHKQLPQFVSKIKLWQYSQQDLQVSVIEGLKQLEKVFEEKWNEETKKQEEQQN